MDLPLKYEDIIRIIPHRYPFLLVDKIVEMELGKRVVGIKNVTANEPFFQGHFPGNPIMPGVLIIEAMAQVGGVLARLSLPDVMEREEMGEIFFVSMDKVKFRKPVVPGDQIRFEDEALRTGGRIWKMAGKAFVDGDLVAEANLVAVIR
ncbi:MAG: 3-hydroxyacyl-ACP dehydratase FabZ [Desulfobacteraceae bacterium]|uniref:3-hydroxyacyl-[acyl-carrier-protein] dehydratase FabZ n=1 Tax=Candidatus Desulfacyla euxinica TaxID=2841693 RepID=A0A8J6MZ53_9DELT|nr:3-hydroxyacyl-ACP dehydratase FabZ [Candidatus Desulfacyla euxinica]MBL6978616.1 3-hydroxyacyl-ACP dehydratase FabZ [Desulfobacteraceae bacterium]